MKKLIVLIIVVVLSSFYVLPVYAEEHEHGGMSGSFADVSTSDKYLDEVWKAIDSFADGDMSYESFSQIVDSLTENYKNSNTIDGKLQYGVDNFTTKVTAIVAKMGNFYSELGENGLDYIKDYLKNFLSDYEVLREESTTDLKGYGALLMVKRDPYIDYYYCDYLEINPDDGIATRVIDGHECFIYRYWNSDGHIDNEWYTTLPQVFGFKWVPRYYTLSYYGDVRYTNGEKAPTNDEYVVVEDYDFTDSTYKDLDDLLNKIIEELNRQQPDFSSIEGILKAIYYQCTGINSKMITYDQCNALIMSLLSSGNSNTEQIVNALYQIRDGLKNSEGKEDEKEESGGDVGGGDSGGDSGGTADKKEIAGTLYNVKPLDKNFLQNLVTDKQNLRVEYEGKVYYLEDDGTLLLDGKYYYVDMNYDGIYDVDIDFKNTNIYANFDFSSLTSSQKEKLDNIVDSIFNFTSQLVPYTSIASIIPLFQVIVFNTSQPQDIVLKFNATDEIEGFEATILSASFLENEYVKNALSILRVFLVVIGYSWLLAMRKKAASMIGG